MPASTDVPVTVRHPRWTTLPVILVVGVVEAGLLIALGRAVVGGGWSSDDEPVPPAASVAAWLLVPLFAVLLGVGLLAMLASLRRGAQVERLDSRELTGTTDGRETLRVELATARRITYLPGLRTTWQRSGKDADRRLRWTPTGVGYDRLVVEGAGARAEFSSAQRQWPAIVNALRTWAQARPDLCADAETRALLASAYPENRPWWRAVIGPAACALVAMLGLARLTGDVDGLGASVWWGVAFGGLLVGLVVWFVLLLPAFLLVRAAVRVVRTRNPWLPFEPDAHGRYGWLMTGRSGTLLRAPARRTTLGLAWRYLYVAMYAALPVVLGVEVVRLVVAA